MNRLQNAFGPAAISAALPNTGMSAQKPGKALALLMSTAQLMIKPNPQIESQSRPLVDKLSKCLLRER